MSPNGCDASLIILIKSHQGPHGVDCVQLLRFSCALQRERPEVSAGHSSGSLTVPQSLLRHCDLAAAPSQATRMVSWVRGRDEWLCLNQSCQSQVSPSEPSKPWKKKTPMGFHGLGFRDAPVGLRLLVGCFAVLPKKARVPQHDPSMEVGGVPQFKRSCPKEHAKNDLEFKPRWGRWTQSGPRLSPWHPPKEWAA